MHSVPSAEPPVPNITSVHILEALSLYWKTLVRSSKLSQRPEGVSCKVGTTRHDGRLSHTDLGVRAKSILWLVWLAVILHNLRSAFAVSQADRLVSSHAPSKGALSVGLTLRKKGRSARAGE